MFQVRKSKIGRVPYRIASKITKCFVSKDRPKYWIFSFFWWKELSELHGNIEKDNYQSWWLSDMSGIIKKITYLHVKTSITTHWYGNILPFFRKWESAKKSICSLNTGWIHVLRDVTLNLQHWENIIQSTVYLSCSAAIDGRGTPQRTQKNFDTHS